MHPSQIVLIYLGMVITNNISFSKNGTKQVVMLKAFRWYLSCLSTETT